MTQDIKLELLRHAIKNTKQVQAIGRNLLRIFCPHVLGTRDGIWCVLVWQFDGYSNMGDLPNWRYFKLSQIDKIQLYDGPWHRDFIRSRPPKRFLIDRIDTIADPANVGSIRSESVGLVSPGAF